MFRPTRPIAAIALLVLAACSDPGEQAPPAGSFHIDPAGITVSGLSSGGYMATQLHIAHSSLISGAAILAAGQIEFVGDVDAAHLMPTISNGGPCGETAAPYIGQCGFDAAGELLGHLYGALSAPVGDGGELLAFDQAAVAEKTGARGLADSGFVFVPAGCAAGATCRLHVALHGCEMGSDTIGEAFARDGGYNRWAAANDIVMVYPQIKKTRLPLNPAGCWDWWGYDGDDYATRDGRQVRALHEIISNLIAH